ASPLGQSVLATGLAGPQSVAVDGQGDVFIADTGHNQVVEVRPSGTETTINPYYQPYDLQTPISFNQPFAVALDAQGDLLITDGTDLLVGVPPNGVPTVVGGGIIQPPNVAKDGLGDTFIADTNNNQVVQVHADNTAIIVGSGLNQP